MKRNCKEYDQILDSWISNSAPKCCCPKRKADYGVIYIPFSTLSTTTNPSVAVNERVTFTNQNIKGNSISHTANSQDINLKCNATYLVQYSITAYATDLPGGTVSDIAFALTYSDGTVVPGSEQAASTTTSDYLVNLNGSTIVKPTSNASLRLTYVDGLTNPPSSVYILGATVTIIRIK